MMPMNKRKVFLLFLSAMSVSIVVMVIVYGLFIKDLNFSFNVKNPDMAPSPIDGEGSIDDEYRSRARIMSPEEMAKQEEANKTEDADDDSDLAPVEEENTEVTEVTPLSPQAEEAPPPTPEPTAEEAGTIPTLHFVYLDGFSSRDAAEQALGHLQSRALVARPYIRQHNGQVILQFGVFSDRENADAMAQQLRNQQVFVKVD